MTLLLACSVGTESIPDESQCTVVTCQVWSQCGPVIVDWHRSFAAETPIEAYDACAKWQIARQDDCVAACPNAINWTGEPNTDACLLGGVKERACEP